MCDQIYNLISQRDTRLATATAGDICRVAQSLRADTKIMLGIAGASQDIALSTRRDGSDMRVIAVVTLLFLPATFTAVNQTLSLFSDW